ncbi:hypothetical protein AB0N64_09295 [Microbacterium sp. NPDC089318]
MRILLNSAQRGAAMLQYVHVHATAPAESSTAWGNWYAHGA